MNINDTNEQFKAMRLSGMAKEFGMQLNSPSIYTSSKSVVFFVDFSNSKSM